MKKKLVNFFVVMVMIFCGFSASASAEMGTIFAKFDLFNNSKATALMPNSKGISGDQLFADFLLPAFLLGKADKIYIVLYTKDGTGSYNNRYGIWTIPLVNGEGEFHEDVVPQNYKMKASISSGVYGTSFDAEKECAVFSYKTTKVCLNFQMTGFLCFPAKFVSPIGSYIEGKSYAFKVDESFGAIANDFSVIYRDGNICILLSMRYPYHAIDSINFSIVDEAGQEYFFTAPFNKWEILELGDRDYVELDVEQVLLEL